MRALVTGGAGFLGSLLTDRLLQAGIRVDVIDDLSQGSLDNLKDALKHPGLEFHLGTVLDRELIAPLAESADLVFHLAALVGMAVILQAAGRRILDVNARGTYEVLRACAAGGTRCVVFSSSEVYGDDAGAPFAEAGPLGIDGRGSQRSFYAVAKLCSERAALHRHRADGLPVTIVRPFNAVGPRQSFSCGGVLPSLVRCALEGEPLPVYGTGEQRRTFVAGSDMVDQVIGLGLDERAVGGVFNVGGKEELSINALAKLIIEVVGSPSRIVHVPYSKACGRGYTDIMRRRPDLSRIDEFGLLRKLRPIREVIREMAALYRESGLRRMESDRP